MRDDPDWVALDGGHADLELGSRRSPDEATRTRLIGHEPPRLALPRDHPLARQRQIWLADVAGSPSSACGRLPRRRRGPTKPRQRAGFRPDVIFEGDDLSNVRGFVAAGRAWPWSPPPGPDHPRPSRARWPTWTPATRARSARSSSPGQPSAVKSPATDLFRLHVLSRAAADRLPAVAD